MKLNSIDHVYECLPPFRNNRQLSPEEQIVIGLRAVSMPEHDAHRQRLARFREHALGQEDLHEKTEEESRRLIASKVVFIRGLEVEGVGEVTDFETFTREAPRELVAWVALAVMNTEELRISDRKNFQHEETADEG
jgi:hypothetical protein